MRKVTVSNGTISTYAGNITSLYGGGYSGDGGQAINASKYVPMGLTVNSSYVYIADNGNHRIRRITAAGIISTIAGNGTQAFAGDGGAATSAELTNPWGLALDSTGANLYIADIGLNNANCRVRKIVLSTGVISTFAGDANCGYLGENVFATSAQLSLPKGVAVDSSGNVYISDSGADRIRKVSSGIITTFAGNGMEGFSGDGGTPISAKLNSPQGIAVTGTTYYFADNGNERIREIH